MNTNENKVIDRNDELEIDLQRLFSALLDRAWMIALSAVLCAVLFFGGTKLFITPEYQSKAMFYVNNGALSVAGTSLKVSASDLSVSKSLVDSYIVILNTRETLNDVADYAEVERSYGELKSMIHAAAVNSTEIFEVVVTSTDPEEAEKIADAISYILPKRISNIVEGTSAQVVDHAVLPSVPSSPNVMKNTALGMILGFVLAAGAICIYEIFNITIRSEEDVAQCCSHPVLAVVPDMNTNAKGGYYRYGYGGPEGSRRAKIKNKAAKSFKMPEFKLPSKEAAPETVFIGRSMGFAASEAYRMLGTKVQFSFADDRDSHVIGVSSSLPGEGKSLTSINLAHSLSQLNKRVLLIDCDLRKPSLAAKLKEEREPGLSNYLIRSNELEECLRQINLDDGVRLDVMMAGNIPPNPVELLSSDRMKRLLEGLRQSYDFVVLDLPPVKEVSDGMVVANLVDGVLMVTRENYCDRVILGASMKQFEFVNARILGVVLNCSREHEDNGKKYGKYYGRYGYRRYGYRYGYYGTGSGRRSSKES